MPDVTGGPGRRRLPAPAAPRRRALRATIRIGLIAALLLPLLSGSLGSPQVATGDDLSDALAKQKAIQNRIAAQKRKVAELNGLQADLRGRHEDDHRQARRDQRRPGRRQGRGQGHDRPGRRDPDGLRRTGRPARRPRRPARRDPGRAGCEVGPAERAQDAPRRPPPGGLRQRPDLDARDDPVGRLVLRRDRRRRLPHRHRRPGPGPRRPDRQGPEDALRAAVRPSARPASTPASCGPRRPPRRRSSTGAWPISRRRGRSSRSSRPRRPSSSPSSARPTRASP